jgi:hypothetical protein
MRTSVTHGLILIFKPVQKQFLITETIHVKKKYIVLRGKRFTIPEITIILGLVRFTIRGGRLRYKRYDAHLKKKISVELPLVILYTM